MDDLIAFLRARLYEDAVGAVEAGGDDQRPAEVKSPGHWTAGASPYGAVSPNQRRWYVNDGHEDAVIGRVDPQGNDDRGVAQHIARHDPARVLAEVDAKRQIIELHQPITDPTPPFKDTEGFLCSICTAAGGAMYDQQRGILFTDLTVFPCRTLRLLALPYTDHPDYRDAWRP